MKKYILILLFGLVAQFCYAQKSVAGAERAYPTWGVTIERPVAGATIEEEKYWDVVVEIKAAKLVDLVKGVKVTVRDHNNKKICKKRWKSSYLYAFSDGTLVVGKGNAITHLFLSEKQSDGKYYMLLRDKGLY